MTIKTLYRYHLENETVDSLEKPEFDCTERYRLIANEHMYLTNDSINFLCVVDIDKEELPLWSEVYVPEEVLDSISDSGIDN